MVIQVDSREKARAIRKILEEFDKQGIKHPVSKLPFGDYMNYDNPHLVIDRKQNLQELCGNVCQQHERFRREIRRAIEEYDSSIIFLIEHGNGVETLEDVIFWQNPRRFQKVQDEKGRWIEIETNATTGETLYKILCTIKRRYGVDFVFCSKEETGKKIIELLGGQEHDS